MEFKDVHVHDVVIATARDDIAVTVIRKFADGRILLETDDGLFFDRPANLEPIGA